MRAARTTLFLLAAAIGPIAPSPACADATVALWKPTAFDRGGGSGLDLAVSITVSPADGVESLDFVFDYDPAILIPGSVHRSALTDSFSVEADLETPGVVAMSLSGAAPLAGAGEVASILFRVIGSPDDISTLQWVSALLNDGAIPAQMQDGQVPVIEAPSIVGVPDEVLVPGGAQTEVAITADPAEAAAAFDLRVEFNPHVVTASSVQKTTRTQSMTLTANLATPGVVLISLFGTQPILPGGEPVVRITFQAVGPPGDRTPLNLKRGNINEVPSVLDDGLLAVCDGTDPDGDTFTGCSGDCDNLDPGIHPGVTEICNGRDDDCDGAADDGIAPPSGVPVLTLQESPDGAELVWSPVPGATGYDVIRGDLGALLAGQGDFGAATRSCLVSRGAVNTTIDPLDPAAGDGSWHLVRAVNCGGVGSYDSLGPAQQGSRDAAIDQSPDACP